jgi:hypothetical protein
VHALKDQDDTNKLLRWAQARWATASHFCDDVESKDALGEMKRWLYDLENIKAQAYHNSTLLKEYNPPDNHDTKRLMAEINRVDNVECDDYELEHIKLDLLEKDAEERALGPLRALHVRTSAKRRSAAHLWIRGQKYLWADFRSLGTMWRIPPCANSTWICNWLVGYTGHEGLSCDESNPILNRSCQLCSSCLRVVVY